MCARRYFIGGRWRESGEEGRPVPSSAAMGDRFSGTRTRNRSWANKWPLIHVGSLLTLVIFGFDVCLPLGYAGGIPYIIPLLLGLWAGERYTIAAAVVATTLTVVGYYLSPPGAELWIVALNRVGALLSVWIVTGGVVIYGRAARERDELDRQLLVKDRLTAVGEAMATFAHEVANPLNSMYLHAQLIERRASDNSPGATDKVRASASVIASEIERLKKMLDEFRSLSSRQTFVFAPLRLAELVERVLDVHSPHFEDKHIVVIRELDGDPRVGDGIIDGDAAKLTQVLLNLLNNAIEAMPEGGTLSVGIQQAAGVLNLRITDTGSGIPDDLDIFEPFASTKEMNSGLGLPIAVQIMAAHGGSIVCESSSSRGTALTLSFEASFAGSS